MPSRVETVPLPGFGQRGMNQRDRAEALSHHWAEKALHFWIDKSGNIAKRPGFGSVTSTAQSSALVLRTFLAVYSASSHETVASSAARITGTADTQTNRVTGTAVTNGYWKFLNFSGACLAFQQGQTPKRCTSAGGNFADLTASSGSVPTGGAALAAFGRVWCSQSDGSTIKYCALLDENDWGGTDAGSVDMTTIWDNDTIVALAATGASFIVFGRRHIVIFEDGSGSDVGIDPVNMAVVDIITGTGTIARDTVVATRDGDLWFLSEHGVQSFARVLQSRNNPVKTVSKYCDAPIRASTLAATSTGLEVNATFDAERGVYFLVAPNGSSSIVWVLHVDRLYTDEEGDAVAPITAWPIRVTSMDYTRFADGSLPARLRAGLGVDSAGTSSARVLTVVDAQGDYDPGGGANILVIHAMYYSARFRIQDARLLVGKGYHVWVQHKGVITVNWNMMGANDRDDAAVVPGGTVDGLTDVSSAYTNSTGTEYTSSYPWEAVPTATMYHEDHDVELGSEGEWVQVRFNLSSANTADATLFALQEIRLHAELARETS